MSDIVRSYGSASTTAETPLGRLGVWATSREHVGIATRDGWRDAGDAVESVTVQRVAYRVRVDVHPASYYARRAAEQEQNGGRTGHDWQSEPVPELLEELGWSTGRGQNTLTRVDWQNVREMHGSHSANVKARDILTRWAVEWLATDDGRALLEAGQEESDAAERARLEREAGELEEKLEAVRARLEELR